MTKDIIDSNMLIGKTKTEVINLLGQAEGTKLIEKDHLVYDLGAVPSFFEKQEEKLVVIFEDNLVFKVIHSFD
jgi:hypothetical protein